MFKRASGINSTDTWLNLNSYNCSQIATSVCCEALYIAAEL